jgi:hypothetical protein
LFGDGLPDSEPGIKRAVWILEHGGDAVAVLAQGTTRQTSKWTPFVHHLARGRRLQPQQLARQGRLPTAGLTDDTKGSAATNHDVDVGEGMDEAAARSLVGLREAASLEDGVTRVRIPTWTFSAEMVEP